MNTSGQDPTTILVSVPSKMSTPDSTSTPVDPTEALKTILPDIDDALLYLIEPISYKPDTVIIQKDVVNQNLLEAADAYNTTLSHTNKSLLLAINFPLKTLKCHLRDH